MSRSATTLEIVRACEQAEAAHLRQQISSLKQLAPELDPVALPISGGIASLTTASLGRKLNHVSGACLHDPPDRAALDSLSEAYRARGLACEIDLCPHCHPRTLDVFAEAGFQVNAFSNTFWRDLAEAPAQVASPNIRVRGVARTEHDAFVAASVAGFIAQPHPRPRVLLELLARCATMRADTHLYAAELEGEWVATSAFALLPTDLGPVALMYLTSSLPGARGHGMHAALLAQRSLEAHRLGCTIAALGARPGTSSGRNAQRSGFQLAYTGGCP